MSTFGIGTMNQLGNALWETGFKTEQDITDLRSNKRLLAQLREVMLGKAKIKYLVSSLDIEITDGYRLEREFPNNFEWDVDKFFPFISNQQIHGWLISIEALCSQVAKLEPNLVPMNAAVAKLLCTHQWLIEEIVPYESEIEMILFVGTVYIDINRMRYVLCLKKNRRCISRPGDLPKWELTHELINFNECNRKVIVALLKQEED